MKTIKHLLDTVKEESPVIYWTVLLNAVFIPICLFGLAFDDRMVMGVNAWIKPLKFAISGGIFTFTVGYLFSIYPYSSRKKTIIGHIVGWTLLVDVGIISYQASRGVQSHYNMNSLLDGILYSAMGIFIMMNVVIMILFLVDTIRLKLNTTKTIQIALFMGWIIVILGSWVGGQMISQLSHNVGVNDGGAGLPLVNWSTKGGDLRIAHFFGLHGIQVIPLIALWFQNKFGATSKKTLIFTIVFGILYAAWIGFTFYQAKQGIPLIKA